MRGLRPLDRRLGSLEKAHAEPAGYGITQEEEAFRRAYLKYAETDGAFDGCLSEEFMRIFDRTATATIEEMMKKGPPQGFPIPVVGSDPAPKHPNEMTGEELAQVAGTDLASLLLRIRGRRAESRKRPSGTKRAMLDALYGRCEQEGGGRVPGSRLLPACRPLTTGELDKARERKTREKARQEKSASGKRGPRRTTDRSLAIVFSKPLPGPPRPPDPPRPGQPENLEVSNGVVTKCGHADLHLLGKSYPPKAAESTPTPTGEVAEEHGPSEGTEAGTPVPPKAADPQPNPNKDGSSDWPPPRRKKRRGIPKKERASSPWTG